MPPAKKKKATAISFTDTTSAAVEPKLPTKRKKEPSQRDILLQVFALAPRGCGSPRCGNAARRP